jgi:glycosyltransferase involved in cell wall biosynthesis
MKITTILTSYDRPDTIQHSLESIMLQEGPAETIIVDDMSPSLRKIVDIVAAVKPPADHVIGVVVMDGALPTHEERMKSNRLSQCINAGLFNATGDIITYLCDDDYFLPGWFAKLREAYKDPKVNIAYGRQYVSGEMSRRKTVEECIQENGQCRWFERVDDPFGKLDHNQVTHRRSLLEKFPKAAPIWPIEDDFRCGADAYFFRRAWVMNGSQSLTPVDHPACVKRFHTTIYQAIYTP